MLMSWVEMSLIAILLLCEQCTSSKLIVLLMVQTSNIAIAQKTVRDVMLKERVQTDNVQNGSNI